MDLSSTNIFNFCSLYNLVGINVNIFDFFEFENFSLIASDKTAWPNGVYNIINDRGDEELVNSICSRTLGLSTDALIISVDNEELDRNLRKSKRKYFPIERWVGMYRGISSNEEFGEESANVIDTISRESDVIEWVQIVSEELFNCKMLAPEVFAFLFRNGQKLIALKRDGKIVGTALIYEDEHNVSG